ncbi:MAG: flagellar hook protein FlgE [Pseudomonadota bacterium]|nr:flagellar hook protein FlgE [Pseudomonadota bacterium]
MGVAFDLNALSGINAASNGLGVISNNLANAQTVGFKGSRAEFADMFSGTQNSAGNGVRVDAVTQDFTQGTLAGTGRELDMAIDGEGFFILEDKAGKYDAVYTRNGSFKLDKDGYLTDQSDNRVQGYLLNETLSTESSPVFDTTLGSVDLDEVNKKPRATDEMIFDLNLDGQEVYNVDSTATDFTTGSVGTVDNLALLINPTTADDYSGFPDFSTNKIVHDTLGGEHRITANFYKRGVVEVSNSNDDLSGDGVNDKYTSWMVQYTVQDYDEDTGTWLQSGIDDIDGNGIIAAGEGNSAMLFELRFDANGVLQKVYEPDNRTAPSGDAPIADPITGEPVFEDLAWADTGSTSPEMNWLINSPITGAIDPITFSADFSDMTEFSGTYNIRGVSQNGYKVGDLVGLSTGLDGVIQARYSNGRSIPVAQLALANFADKNAMEKLGGQTYAETYASGTRQLGAPQSVGLGTVNSGSLEYSNVDVAGELVNMIQTQRTYQASAQVISTSQTLTQTILNL